MKLHSTKISSANKTFSLWNVIRAILNSTHASILEVKIPIQILIALLCIFSLPATASDSIKQMNATIVSDLNQTVGKDILSLVDTDSLETNANPF
ncbi:MAG: hypothetical protein RBT65_03575 [Methanolobus sp.]|jgi:hypothetical protein|nr:hypothetical protein [Methanolobus sp.]